MFLKDCETLNSSAMSSLSDEQVTQSSKWHIEWLCARVLGFSNVLKWLCGEKKNKQTAVIISTPKVESFDYFALCIQGSSLFCLSFHCGPL